jgi:hypothetical protein
MSDSLSEDHLNLIRAVGKLAHKSRNGWVTWKRVAKNLEGSEEFSYQEKALADLPEMQKYFMKNEKVVKLGPLGWELYRQLSTMQLHQESVTAQIARSVKEYASNLKPLSYKVYAVAKGAHVGQRIVQALSVDSEETFATDTPVTYRSENGWETNGKVVGQEPDGAKIYIALECEIFPDFIPGSLEIDRGFLLHSLADHIETLPDMPHLAGILLNGSGKLAYDLLYDTNAVVLADRLVKLQTPWARFLWGPPGAGKTYGIGSLVAQLLQEEPNEKHLVVAPSNRAVDVAVIQFLKSCDGMRVIDDLLKKRRILRFGYPRIPEVLEHSEILGPENLNDLLSAVDRVLHRIQRAERHHEPEENIARLRAELLNIQEQLRDKMRAHVLQSTVVFTTSTLAYLTSDTNPIGSMKWSSVIVDEVTMVPPAHCVFLGSLAQSRFLLAGDPRQLGPIYESNDYISQAYEWMGKDIFEKAAVSLGAGGNRRINSSDGRITRIVSQRRCCPGIWSRVKSLYPQISNKAEVRTFDWLQELPPGKGESVVLIDISELSSRCEKKYQSWQNTESAEVAMEIACSVVGDAKREISIAMITPYRAQVRLLKRWLRNESRSENPAYRQIEAGTVHQFQGSDADLVIFDLVDGVGRSGLGVLLRGDIGLRLVNVAITRARGKFVIIANPEWFSRHACPDQNPLLWELVTGIGTGVKLKVDPPKSTTDETSICESPIERRLLSTLENHQVLSKIVPQYSIYDEDGKLVTRADFAFPEIKYAIYCDGAQWHLRQERWQKDWRQRNKLTELGWIFSVFTGFDVNRYPYRCAKQVLETHARRRKQILT